MNQLRKLIKKLIRENQESLNELGEDISSLISSPEYQNKRIILSHEEEIKFRPAESQSVSYKPRGLWYGFGDSWLDWVRHEMPDWEKNRQYDHAFLLEINETSVLKLSSHADLWDFTDKYKIQDPSYYFETNLIDWSKVVQDYSGIEIAPYIHSARRDRKTNWYYPWDIASGCIWDSNGIKSISKII